MGYSPASAIPLNSFGAPTANINMNTHKFTSLLDGSAGGDTAGWDQLVSTATQYAYVANGCVWSGVSGLNGTMTSGTVVIGGLAYSVASIASHAFTASNETYIDINIQSGAAVVNFTAVPNWTQAPALVSSSTQYTAVRVAVVVAGAATANYFTGAPGSGSGLTQPASSVAAGSNGANINAATLNTNAQSTAFPTGGGWAVVNHSTGAGSPILYVIQFTGATSSTLTGVTVVQGAGIVSTNDVITGILPLGVTDSLGNLIYCVNPYPRVIGWSQFQNTITTTSTSSVPLQVNNATGFITPFIVPAGPPRLVRVEANLAFLGSSAAAGTLLTLTSGTAAFTAGVGTVKVAVASDGAAMFTTGIGQFQGGSLIAFCNYQQGAAGTLTAGATYLNSNMAIELV